MIGFAAQLVRTLQITIPLLLSTQRPEDSFEDDDCSLLSRPVSKVDVSMGELLYPSFNQLVPSFVELVIPNLSQLGQLEGSLMLQTYQSMIQFAFKTQIYEKRIPAIIKGAKAAGRDSKPDNIEMLMSSLRPDGNAMHQPQNLAVQFKSKSILKRLKQKQGSTSQHGLLPLYQLFREPYVHSLICEDLMKFLTPQKKGQSLLQSTSTAKLKTSSRKKLDSEDLETFPVQASVRDQVTASILIVMLSTDLQEVRESLDAIKSLLSSHKEEVSSILLSDSSNAIPVLSLTLALPELVTVTVTIFLALSFLQTDSEHFSLLMQEPVTFEIFQHALIQQRNSPIFEDFVVILQKLTLRDPVPMRTLMSSRLIECLNSHLVCQGGDFVGQNIKSILKNI
jgi:hypothetical protein